MEFLFLLIAFEPILHSFLRFGKFQKSKMVDQDVRHSEIVMQLLRHVMLSPHDADVRETFLDILSTLLSL